MQWQDFFVAFALLMVWEGLLPSISPAFFRRFLENMLQMDDASLRRTGLISMIIGAVLVYFIKQYG